MKPEIEEILKKNGCLFMKDDYESLFDDIETYMDEIKVNKQRELLKAFVVYAKARSIQDINIDDDTILYFLEDLDS